MSEPNKSEAQTVRVTRLLRTLLAINAIVRAEDRDTLFQEVCRILTERGSVRMAWIGLVSEATGLVRPVAQAGSGLEYLEELIVRLDDSPEGPRRGARGPHLGGERAGQGLALRLPPDAGSGLAMLTGVPR